MHFVCCYLGHRFTWLFITPKMFQISKSAKASPNFRIDVLLIWNILATANSFSACRILSGTKSPNGEFALGVCKLDAKDWKTDPDGLSLDESLFIVGLRTEDMLREISEDYRRSSSASWPKYRGVWSAVSSKLGS
jgi:hypothetical protein